jgi:hypothetical protein
MREAALRSVLIVKAIEETDGTDFLISDEARRASAREAKRDAGVTPAADELNDRSPLPARAQHMLAARAEALLAPVVTRHPFLGTVSKLASGPRALGWALAVLSVLCGVALSALDGPRRIDVLSLPLLGLVAWNALVYALVIAGWLRSSNTRARQPLLPSFMTAWGLRNARRFVARSGPFNAPLAAALDRFMREWSEVAKPLLLARASRVFHLCAAAAGAGLIAGLYLRGMTLDYAAGWESTFLDAADVHRIVSLIYAPASAATAIGIPDVAQIERIRWENGGERAARWMHLLAATVVLFVVIPRLALVVLGTLSVWRRSLRAPLPASLTGYFRKTFGGDGALRPTSVVVIPYAYEPSHAAVAALRSLLASALGENGSVDVRVPVRYGDEDKLLETLGRSSGATDAAVVLLNLAATPEEENHGVVLSSARHRLAAARPAGKLLVMVDEGPYALRMGAQGGPSERIAERRRVWQAFIEAHDSHVCFANLAAPHTESAGESPGAEVECVRAALLHSGAA